MGNAEIFLIGLGVTILALVAIGPLVWIAWHEGS